jgi:hypothetical protein
MVAMEIIIEFHCKKLTKYLILQTLMQVLQINETNVNLSIRNVPKWRKKIILSILFCVAMETKI